ncbi:hypothetical protein N752_16620 [Desulforamulus aquiferis]|nr:hypothetical protein N752_16620 [Desulforamulus aquiferis]
MEMLGNDIKIITSQSPYPKEPLRQADVVIIPVLTQNTAAKVALTISDTMASYLIISALMLSKPVIAARDAAEPINRPQVELSKLKPAFREVLEGNLKKLSTYGIQLTSADNLSKVTKGFYFRSG